MRSQSVILSLSLLLLGSLSLALSMATTVAAQIDEKEKAEKEAKRSEELERKTLALLDEVIADAWSLKLPENRSFVLLTAADALWTHDEKRARSLFWDALNNLSLTIGVAIDEGKKVA